MQAARTLREFDDLVTAPLHGFKGVDDYYARASSKPYLPSIATPTLILNARNDPFLPAQFLPSPQQVSAYVTLETPATGGHVGVCRRRFSG
jgi:predicted alpha/beta-fold hydrolase